jgi:hypothetical protein
VAVASRAAQFSFVLLALLNDRCRFRKKTNLQGEKIQFPYKINQRDNLTSQSPYKISTALQSSSYALEKT